jgi:hypothetical protein
MYAQNSINMGIGMSVHLRLGRITRLYFHRTRVAGVDASTPNRLRPNAYVALTTPANESGALHMANESE